MKAWSLIREALRFCREKANGRASWVISDLRSGDSQVHSVFRYALAGEISRHLAGHFDEIKAAYLFGSAAKDSAGTMSDLDIIFVTRRKNKNLSHAVEELNSQVLRGYKKLIGNNASAMNNLLDINIVNEKDVKNKKGYASLINSIHMPALKIQSGGKQ